MALNGGADPYAAKNFDFDFMNTRSPNLFSLATFGVNAEALGLPQGFTNSLTGATGGDAAMVGLPAWFWGGALLIAGAAVFFATKGKVFK